MEKNEGTVTLKTGLHECPSSSESVASSVPTCTDFCFKSAFVRNFSKIRTFGLSDFRTDFFFKRPFL